VQGTLKLSRLSPGLTARLVKICLPAPPKVPSPAKSTQASSFPPVPVTKTSTCAVPQAVIGVGKVTPSSSLKQEPIRPLPAALSSPSACTLGWPSGSVSTQRPSRSGGASGSTRWRAAPAPWVP
jgi:hypothetical protein